MKVLVIADTTNVRCGWGRYAAHVIEESRKKGVNSVVLSSASSDMPGRNIPKDEHPVLLEPNKISNIIKNVFAVRKLITKDVDAVHAFESWPFAVYAALALVGKNKPLFITGVGTYSIPPKKGKKAFLMRFAYMKAKEIFCISHYTLGRIKEYVPKANFSIVFCGATALPALSQSDIELYKNKFGIRDNKTPIILTVGQIKQRKGQLDTLKAVGLLKEKYTNILYIAFGSSSDTFYVNKILGYAKENNTEDSLKIIDNCEDDRCLAFFYNTATIFAMNSNNEGNHFEGFGLVFLEAAQFGKPAVGSRGTGIEDAIEDGKTGFLTNQGDAADVAEKIDKLLSGDTKKFGEAARARAKEFTWEKTMDQYIASYKKYVS